MFCVFGRVQVRMRFVWFGLFGLLDVLCGSPKAVETCLLRRYGTLM